MDSADARTARARPCASDQYQCDGATAALASIRSRRRPDRPSRSQPVESGERDAPLAPGEVRIIRRHAHETGRRAPRRNDRALSEALNARASRRAGHAAVDGGPFPSSASSGRPSRSRPTSMTDGHESSAAELLWRPSTRRSGRARRSPRSATTAGTATFTPTRHRAPSVHRRGMARRLRHALPRDRGEARGRRRYRARTHRSAAVSRSRQCPRRPLQHDRDRRLRSRTLAKGDDRTRACTR